MPTDLLFRYPFPGGDGYDWIANGLAMAGEQTRWSGRPPLLPALIAALHRLGWLGALPFVLFGMLGLLAVCCAYVAVPEGPRATGRRLRVALLFFASAAFLRQGFEVMADVTAAALGAASLAVGLSALRRGRDARWLWAGLLAGIGSLAQPAALYAVAGLATALLLGRRQPPRPSHVWMGLALAVAPLPATALARYFVLGSAENVAFLHRTLLGWHPELLAYYRDALPAVLGAPAVLAVVAGSVPALRELRRRSDLAVAAALGSGVVVALFFGVLYGFPAQRFTIYLAPFLAVAFDRALEAIRRGLRPWVAGATAALALGCAAVPSGGEHVTVLWPAPLARFDGATGRLLLGGLGARLRDHPAPAMGAYLARPESPSELDAERFAEIEALVYLYDETAPVANFFVEALRLGNAIGKRGRALPAGLLPADFFPRGSLRFELASDGYRLFRFDPFADRESDSRVWLVAVSERGGVEPTRWLSRRARRPALGRWASALADASCADELLPSRDAPLVLLGDEVDLAVAAAGFATRTGTLLVVPPRDAPRWRERLRDLPRERELDCASLQALRIRWQGFPYTVWTSRPSP